MFLEPGAAKSEWEEAVCRWNNVLDHIIEGFEAYNRMGGGYDDELGPYSMLCPHYVSKKDWKKISRGRKNQVSRLQQRDRDIFLVGMALFVAYFDELWD